MPPEDENATPAEDATTAVAPSEPSAEEAETASAWAEVRAEVTGDPAPSVGDTETQEAPASASAAEAGAEGEQEAGSTDEGATAAESATETAADDIWNEAPETLKSAYDAEKARADKAEHAFRSRDGREAALQRRIDSMIASGGEQSRQPPVNRQSADDTSTSTDETLAELATLEADYPEIAKPLKTILQRNEARHRTEITRLSQALQLVGEERLAARSSDAESAVVESHPDYTDIANSDEFVAWYEEQPQYIQVGIRQNAENIVDPRAVSRILDDYKRDRGIAPAGRSNGSTTGNGKQNGSGERQQADAIRRAQLRSNRGGPRPSPGATVARIRGACRD